MAWNKTQDVVTTWGMYSDSAYLLTEDGYRFALENEKGNILLEQQTNGVWNQTQDAVTTWRTESKLF